MNAATPADFARWTDAAARMTDAELVYAARDAAEAATAVDSHNAIQAGRYRDELMTYETELAARRRA